MKFVVSCHEHGWSLLKFILDKTKGALSSRKIKQMIDGKRCTVSGKVEIFSSRLLVEGDVVEWKEILLQKEKEEILFEDDDFVIINKLAGTVSEEKNFPKSWTLIHRLDKETSGALLFSKTPRGEKAALELFSSRKIEKLYLAIVDGVIAKKQGVIDNFLGKKGGREGQTRYGSLPSGLRAITHYQVLSSSKQATLLLVTLKTGRTHQIRVHTSEMGHPILGDHQYGIHGFSCPYPAQRHLLHAWKLSFLHPFSHREIEIEAPIPKDFQEACVNLKLK